MPNPLHFLQWAVLALSEHGNSDHQIWRRWKSWAGALHGEVVRRRVEAAGAPACLGAAGAVLRHDGRWGRGSASPARGAVPWYLNMESPGLAESPDHQASPQHGGMSEVKLGRPFPRLGSQLVRDAARNGLSCNMAQVRSSDKHLKLNEIYEYWQEKCLCVRYCSLSPVWVTCGSPGLIEGNSLEVWAVILSLYYFFSISFNEARFFLLPSWDLLVKKTLYNKG